MKVAVLGAGVGGLAAALALARADHEVTLLERDAQPPPPQAIDAAEWDRPGIPHFLQPHTFMARGGKELRAHAPDVYAALIDAGADELRLAEKMPSSTPLDEDDDLRVLACRRPVMEWVLRKALGAEKAIDVRSGVAVLGLLWEQSGSEVPRAVGVATPQGEVRAELIVDATGRSSLLSEWIVDAGGSAPQTLVENCGVVYYSRYFRFLPGQQRPAGPWLIAPRAELDYLETGTFWGDNATFAVVQQISAEDRELRALRHADVFMASLKTQPPIAPLIAEGVSEPITPVLPMGQLRSTLRTFVSNGRLLASGVIALGDTRCHTNPRYAWGLSLALSQAFLLAGACTNHGSDLEAIGLEFEEAAHAWAEPAFRAATATDNERKRYWSGEGLDPTDPKSALQLFLLTVFPIAGVRDPEIFRRAVRRLMLLDDPMALETDRELIDRGAAILREMFEVSPRPPQGPVREDLVGILKTTASR